MQKQPFKRNKFFALLFVMPLLAISVEASAIDWFTQDNSVNQGLMTGFSSQQARFIHSVLNSTDKVNQGILQDREKLLSLQTQYQNSQHLSSGSMHWLTQLASDYKYDNFNISQSSNWSELVKRVDIVPASLVLAQAIQESGWGKSRLARDANNYFGQECFEHGCGVPASHSRYSYHEMAKYDDMDDAINTYIHNLNSNRAYVKMRNIRYDERTQHQTINSLALVNGMLAYSELRGNYVASIKHLVSTFDLQKFDSISA